MNRADQAFEGRKGLSIPEVLKFHVESFSSRLGTGFWCVVSSKTFHDRDSRL